MPRGGTKCPMCGYRFKTRRQNDNGTVTSDLVLAESKIKGYPPNEREYAWLCPGSGGKGAHPPMIIKIQRIHVSESNQLVKMKIISAYGAELLDMFTDRWTEANKRKYRPDLIFR